MIEKNLHEMVDRPKALTSCFAFGGIGDEAGLSIDQQIDAQCSLGWNCLELRSIDGVPLAKLSAEVLKAAVGQIKRRGMKVPALASAIGSWSRSISTPLAEDLDELNRLCDLALDLDCQFIRIMSYPNDGRSESAWRDAVFERISHLADRVRNTGVMLLHENCSGWAGQSACRARELVDTVGADALQLLFDVGNPVVHGYDGFTYLQAVIDFVKHVHVKDAKVNRTRPDEAVFAFPGDGQSRLLDCLQYLVQQGYRGVVSLEPHIAHIPHLRKTTTADELSQHYQEFGRAFLTLLDAEKQSAVNRQRSGGAL